MKQKIQFTLTLFVVAMVLHGAWEFLHQGLYTVHGQSVPVVRLLQSILGDGVFTVLLYLITGRRTWLTVLLGLILAITIEYRAVYVEHLWEYRQSMPMILGLGLSPLLQMSALPSLAIWLTQHLFGTVGSKIVARF